MDKIAELAFTMDIATADGRQVTIGVPVGMTVGEVEDQLHERYWAKPDSKAASKGSDE